MRFLFAAASLIVAFSVASTGAQEAVDLGMVARIKEEGLQRSRAQELYLTLSDAIGARLTGSPSHVQAARWARERLTEWGLANARLEPFQFGRGWSLEKISVEMTSPRYMPLMAYADAWTPSVGGVVSGRAVYIGDKTSAEIRAWRRRFAAQSCSRTCRKRSSSTPIDRSLGSAISPSARATPPARRHAARRRPTELLPLLQSAGAGVALKPSAYRDGTVGVLGNRNTNPDAVPSITIAAEQYNMLARLAAANVPVALRIELRTRYQNEDLNTYNVIAEIPGTDPALRDQVVLVGAHLDSWHTANGATDNGDGVVAVMEAMRILAAVGAKPRRTIRAALWSGEEQGLLGARAYIEQHLASQADRERLAVYLNDDPGSGKTLGFYMEGNTAAKAIFDAWLEPLKDLGVTRNIIEGIGSTDHVPFNDVALPGFNVIKDFDAYDERTRHTNADFPERMTKDELSQSAIVLATFAWHAAMRNERIPRTTRATSAQ